MSNCQVCKHPFTQHIQPGYIGEPHCSEFCATVTEADRVKFLTLKPGEFGIFPCPECGCVIEDEYDPDDCCSSCAPERASRVRGGLLKKALPYLQACAKHGVPGCWDDKVMDLEVEGLIKAIQREVKS